MARFILLICLLLSEVLSVYAGNPGGAPGIVTFKSPAEENVYKKGPTIWVKNYSFKVLSQNDVGNIALYPSQAWAETNKRYKWTCLATVYAMIEEARNNSYQINDETWSDKTGAQGIEGTSKNSAINIDLRVIREQFLEGNPVIIQLANKDVPSHFVLAVGIDANQNLVALDPWRGDQITISTASSSWTTYSKVSSSEMTVVQARTVDM